MKDDDPRASDVAAETHAPADATTEHPLVTVDVVILTMRRRRLEALLIKRKRWPYEGLRAIPGGFVGRDESLEDAAWRVLADRAIVRDVRDVYLEQLYTFGDPHRDPRARVITVVYYALIRADALADALHVALTPPDESSGSGGLSGGAGSSDAAESAWFPVDALPPMAFDHAGILLYTMQRLRGKLEYTDIGYQLLGPEFTLSELQEVYEAILSRSLDKRNFRKKVLSTGILEPTAHTRKSGQHRPAALYRFSPRAERGA